MSTPEPTDHAAHASHHHEETLPEEPKTPLWVTALGVALLVSGGLGYLLVHEPAVEPEAKPEPAAAAEEAKPAATPDTPPQPPRARPRLPRGFPPALQASSRMPRPPAPTPRNAARPGH